MGIKELYEIYQTLKEQGLSDKKLEWGLYEKLIMGEDTEEDNLSSYDIKNEVLPRPSNPDERMEYYQTRRYMDFRQQDGFIYVQYLVAGEYEKNYIKYYLSVPNELKKEFMVEYGKLVKENEIRGMYKIRKNAHANDLVTVRVYNPKHYKRVFEFLKQYRDNTPQHLFMPTVDGIGVTIDDNNSYNRTVVDLLINYFEQAENEDTISIPEFLKYVNSDATGKMPTESKVLYSINLLNAFDENFSLEGMIEMINDSQNELYNRRLESLLSKDVNQIISNAKSICHTYGAERAINYIVEQNYGAFRPSQKYLAISMLKNQIRKNPDFDESISVKEYLARQFMKMDRNIEKVYGLIENEFTNNGIEGVKDVLQELHAISTNSSDKYQLDIEKTFIPYCYVDRLHPLEWKSDEVNAYSIKRRMTGKNLIENEFWSDEKTIIEHFNNRISQVKK